MAKVDLNQILIEEPAYIVVDIEWSVKLILPYNKGLDFIKIWATGVQTDSQLKNMKKPDKEFRISFLSEQHFNELKMDMVLEPED